MRRILFITSKPYFPWEGASHRTRITLEALTALDYAVDVLTVPLGEPFGIPTVTPLLLPRLPFCRSLPDAPSIRRFVWDSLMLFKAVFLAGKNNYTLIHGIDDAGVVAWLAARLTHTPCVFEQQTASARNRVRGPRRLWLGIHRLFERAALKRADAVIGSDPALVAKLTHLGRRSRACVIPDIPALADDVPLPARNLACARFKNAPDQKLVTCVGSYLRFHGLDLFFNAIPRVIAVHPNTRFIVVGGDTREIQRMNKALAKASVEANVVFAGRLPPPELAALLAISDVLVSPRRAGTSAPIKLLDYLRSGTPVVAADTPANRAVLSPDNALITRPTPEALSDGIIRLCHAPHLGEALGRRGHDTLQRENRTPEAFRLALRHCYDYVLTAH